MLGSLGRLDRAAGAEIVSAITEHGLRSYTAAGCENRHWMFAQSGPRVGR